MHRLGRGRGGAHRERGQTRSRHLWSSVPGGGSQPLADAWDTVPHVCGRGLCAGGPPANPTGRREGL